MEAWRATSSIVLLMALVGSLDPSASTAASPTFNPQRFFVGSTQGEGTLKVLLSPSRHTHVTGSGRLLNDQTLVLVQTVAIEGRTTREREWRLRELTPGHYEGTLTDASGPVTGDNSDGRLHLQYRMRGGMIVQQWLKLEASGRSAQNHLTITKLGIPVATIDETIRR